MKILALTDLSSLSKVGVRYAAKLCVALNAELIVMNVLKIDQLNQMATGFNVDNANIKRLVDERENECRQLIAEVRSEVPGNFKAEYSVEHGDPFEETVNTFALRHRCELIVMGTKGASGIKKMFLGSNAAAVIENSPIPVLTVPEFAFCKEFKDLVYASDMKSLFDEFAILLPLAKLFNATVHVLHISQSDNIPKVNELTMAETLQKKFEYPKIDCTYIVNADVKSGIDQYLNVRNTDVLAMFSGKRDFFARIFEKSSSREMALQTTVPLLTFSK